MAFDEEKDLESERGVGEIREGDPGCIGGCRSTIVRLKNDENGIFDFREYKLPQQQILIQN